MLRVAGRPLSLTIWLTVPLLFSSAVLGLTGLAGLLVGAFGPDVELFSPVFGAATALTVAASGAVAWTAPWQRTWLRWPYPVSVFVGGILVDGVQVPVLAVVVIGVPVIALLLVQCVVERRCSDALAGQTPQGKFRPDPGSHPS